MVVLARSAPKSRRPPEVTLGAGVQQGPSDDRLTAVIDETTWAMNGLPTAEQASWLFARCWLLARRHENGGRSLTDLEAALTDFDALPPDHPGRARLATVLANALVRSRTLTDLAATERAIRLADIGDTDPVPLDQWPQSSAALRALDLMVACREGRPGFNPHAALADVERYGRVVGGLEPHALMISTARVALQHLISEREGDVHASQRVADDAKDLAAAYRNGKFAAPGDGAHPPAPEPAGVDHATLFSLLTEIQATLMRGDVAGAVPKLQRVVADIRRLPPGDPRRVSMEEAWQSVTPLFAQLGVNIADLAENDGGPPGHDAAGPPTASPRSAAPPVSATERALRLFTQATVELGTDTVRSVSDAVQHAREALELATEDDPRRTYYLLLTGSAHLRRQEMTGAADDLAAGTRLLEQARERAASTEHPLWTTITVPLAHAYRLSGRRDLCRSTALAGLRGHIWSVLLQPDPHEMQAAARHAAEDALQTARWCLEDDDAEGAATALDAGRGLILHAATETRDIEARLAARGETALAEEWRRSGASRAPDDAPAELRRRVIGALAGVALNPDGSRAASLTTGSTEVLDPPTLHEVRAALLALGADALVYLVPGDEGSGAALVIPAAEPPSRLLLPALNRAGTADFDGFLTVAARGMTARGATADGDVPSADHALRDARVKAPDVLGGITDWAWRAAVGPLLDHLTQPADRPVRLVLVPVRELTRVPWHAATRTGAVGRPEYAMERAVFSYAASARLLCESAWRSPVPLTDTGLFVGDPDPSPEARDLPAARTEALAVRDAFYPGARYLGRQRDGSAAPDGAGTRDQVLAWLADPDGGPLLHLACHGVVTAGTGADDSSYLLLDRAEHLAAERLVRTLGSGPDRGIALAVLAACSSATSGRGYDEAFSLSTTLLAGRVRSVISATWSVPDAATSVFMYMFHHYLRVESLPPVDALRRAQLWMITPAPEPPPAMPERLRAHLRRHDPADLTAWASFIHIGR